MGTDLRAEGVGPGQPVPAAAVAIFHALERQHGVGDVPGDRLAALVRGDALFVQEDVEGAVRCADPDLLAEIASGH